jgi:hypothetical protein
MPRNGPFSPGREQRCVLRYSALGPHALRKVRAAALPGYAKVAMLGPDGLAINRSEPRGLPLSPRPVKLPQFPVRAASACSRRARATSLEIRPTSEIGCQAPHSEGRY